MEIIYQDIAKSVTLSMSKEGQLFVIKVSGKVKDESYKTTCEKHIEGINSYGFRRIVYDFRDAIHTDIQSRAWYTTTFLPRIIKRFGTNFKVAIIKSKSNYENLGINFMAKVSETLGFKDTVKFFDDAPEAMDWILNEMPPKINGM